MSNGGVYEIINTVNGKKYVGSSIDIRRRWLEHKCELRNGRHNNKHLQHSYNKHGKKAFKFSVLVYTCHEEGIRLENMLLATDNYEYNIARDALAPMFGVVFSDEHRLNISRALTGKKFSDEHRRKLSEAAIGRSFSDETKRKISRAGRGRKFTEEHKRNISSGLLGHKLSDETKRKISRAHYGKHLSASHKQKISNTLTGRQFTEEHKRKIGEQQTGKKNHNWIELPTDKMKSLRQQGYTYDKIGKIFGVCEETARKRILGIT